MRCLTSTELHCCVHGDVQHFVLLKKGNSSSCIKQPTTWQYFSKCCLAAGPVEEDAESEDLVLGELPLEVLRHMFSLLDPLTLGTASCVCSTWHHLSQDEALWKRCLAQVAVGGGSSHGKPTTYRQHFNAVVASKSPSCCIGLMHVCLMADKQPVTSLIFVRSSRHGLTVMGSALKLLSCIMLLETPQLDEGVSTSAAHTVACMSEPHVLTDMHAAM